jgi:hypothetical protein
MKINGNPIIMRIGTPGKKSILRKSFIINLSPNLILTYYFWDSNSPPTVLIIICFIVLNIFSRK